MEQTLTQQEKDSGQSDNDFWIEEKEELTYFPRYVEYTKEYIKHYNLKEDE